MDEARAEFLRHKEAALAAKREGRLDDARAHFLAAGKALLTLAAQVRSPEEKASLLETARALTAKANELKGQMEGTPAADGDSSPPDLPARRQDASAPPPPEPAASVRPAPASKLDPGIFLASAPGQAMRAQILSALSSALPLSAEVDLSALAAETQGMGGPDLLALLADACRRAQPRFVAGRADWSIGAADIAASLARRQPSASSASVPLPVPVPETAAPGAPPSVDARVQETLTEHGLPPNEAAAFDDLLALTEDRQLLGELLADRARDLKSRLAKRRGLETLKPYIATLDRGIIEHLLSEILADPLSLDPAQLDSDLKALAGGQAGERWREMARRLVDSYRGLLPPEEITPIEARLAAEPLDLAGIKSALEDRARRARFDKAVDAAVGAMSDASPSLRGKLARKAKRLLSPTLDSAALRTGLLDLRARLAAFYEGQKKEGEEPKDPIAHVEDLVLDVCPVDYDDVAGMDDVKRALEFAIESPLRDHEVILRATGRPPENTGILLYGPPGCGKTFIALAAAGEFRQKHGVTVISVPLEAVLALHWSKQVERIVDIFELARRRAPSIVIWDEFDTYASDPRVTNRKYDEKLCTTFKQQFEGVMKSEKPIIHVATSNYPWKLEIPLLRPGRLGDIQYIPPPDLSARRELFEVLLGGANVDAGVDVAELANATEGAVSAEIKAVVRKALEAPVKEYIERGRKDPLRKATMEDLRAAVKGQNVGQFAAWLRLAGQEIGKERFLPVQPLFQALQKEIARLGPGEQA